MPEETAAQVVEEIRADGAAEAAGAAAAAAAAGTAIVTEEVAAVSTQLEEHAELSEDRHEEILEAGEWQRRTSESLLTMQQALAAQVTALQAATLAELAAIRAELAELRQSAGSPPSSQTPPVEPAPAETLPVNPEEAAAGQENQNQQQPEIPKRKRPVL